MFSIGVLRCYVVTVILGRMWCTVVLFFPVVGRLGVECYRCTVAWGGAGSPSSRSLIGYYIGLISALHLRALGPLMLPNLFTGMERRDRVAYSLSDGNGDSLVLYAISYSAAEGSLSSLESMSLWLISVFVVSSVVFTARCACFFSSAR